MYRFIISWIGVLLFHTTAISAEPETLKTFDSPDGLYSIKLPVTPMSLKAGEGVQGSFYTCDSKELECNFVLGCSELPKLKEGEPVEKLFLIAH